jgi:aspartyl-tRNA(Asn)/glutamyl-tRNA(Gln) amidotransferase subunit C
VEIEHVAMLARLKLTENEKKLFSDQVGSIIDYINKLNELDTGNVQPTSHVLPIKNVFRQDTLKESLPRDSALKNAPVRDKSFYRVPKIIE